jgi:hypothetical protein
MDFKLRYDGPLSNIAINFNLCRYTKVACNDAVAVTITEECVEKGWDLEVWPDRYCCRVIQRISNSHVLR